MIGEKRIRVNSWIIIIYLYLHSMLVPLNYFLSVGQLSVLETVLLVLGSVYLLYANRNNIKLRILWIYLILIILFSVNIFIVTYKSYVYSISIMILISIFIPLVIIGTKKINFTYVLNNWYNLSTTLSIIYLPVLFILRNNKIIGYFELAQFVHLNSIIIFYFIIVKKKNNLISWGLLAINFLMMVTMGSRMILISTLVTYSIIILVLNTQGKLRHAIYSTVLVISSFLLFLNIENILLMLLSLVNKYGISSRNIVLLLQYVQGTEIQDISSGRDAIYPIAKEMIVRNYGFPQGLGALRNATNGQYYHAHNMFLEIIITFGLLVFLMFLIWWIIKFIFLWKEYKNHSVFDFFIITSVPYLIRSLVGTYFLTDSFFLVAFSILFWLNNKEEYK